VVGAASTAASSRSRMSSNQTATIEATGAAIHLAEATVQGASKRPRHGEGALRSHLSHRLRPGRHPARVRAGPVTRLVAAGPFTRSARSQAPYAPKPSEPRRFDTPVIEQLAQTGPDSCRRRGRSPASRFDATSV